MKAKSIVRNAVQTLLYFLNERYFVPNCDLPLKVLSSEIDPAEIRLIR